MCAQTSFAGVSQKIAAMIGRKRSNTSASHAVCTNAEKAFVLAERYQRFTRAMEYVIAQTNACARRVVAEEAN
jgi:hypothetical protein